jgi:glycosyltransferase involved in cell wall biosynthesis
VSVVIPTRNRPEQVETAVRSALAQTYRHLEIVVVDDASSPPLALPQDLAGNPRVRAIRLRVSVGPGEARNIGAGSSRGELLAFLDDDDEWHAEKIARQVETLGRCGPSVAVCESGFDLLQDGRVVMRFLPHAGRDLARVLAERPCLQPSTVLMRRSAFEALGGFDPFLRRVEDWDLWVRLADSFEVTTLPEVLVDRRASRVSPDEALPWYQEMVLRLEPRIQRLPPRARNRARANHALVEAALLAQAGHRRAARARIVLAWRLRPVSWRPPAYMVRTVVGERVWEALKQPGRASTSLLARVSGRDPLVRSW